MLANLRPKDIIRTVLAVAMLAFHFHVVFFGPPQAIYFRGIHLLLAMVLIFLTIPAFAPAEPGARPARRIAGTALDAAFIALAAGSLGYVFLNVDYLQTRFALIDPLRPADSVFAVACILAVLEAARRTTGPALPLTAIGFILFGLTVGGLGIGETLDQIYMAQDGIFGIPLAVSATYVLLFVVFGAVVERSGTGKLFMDFALALAGGSAGGPAKVAVMTSATFGTISGSATANVVTTGAFTIPMMKRIGYRPAYAGAVEAVASTGGQIMPPIMGASAFVMAEFMGVSYFQVIGYALLPAFLYFFAVFMAVHFEARRLGLRGMPKSDLPELGRVVRERGHQILPLVLIIGTMVAGFSAPYAAMIGILSVYPVAMLRRTTRAGITWRSVGEGFLNGIYNALQVAAACACAGIVIGVINLSGLGFDFTSFLVSLSSDSLILSLLLSALAGIILGMGLPTTPAYVVQASLLVPAVVKLGVPAPAAHMFALYFAILSSITPPVAISIIAANSISGARLWESSVASMRLSASGYIIPFMFVFGPALLLIGSPASIVLAICTATTGVLALSAGLNGYLLRPASWPEKAGLVAAALLMIDTGPVTDAGGLALLALVAASQKYLSPAAERDAA